MSKKIRITAVEPADEEQAKILEEVLNKQWAEYGKIVDAILRARRYVEMMLCKQTPDSIWNRIMEEVIKREIEQHKQSEGGGV